MPLGNKYKNWAACIKDQKAKGHSEESAKKICGFIEQQVKQSHE